MMDLIKDVAAGIGFMCCLALMYALLLIAVPENTASKSLVVTTKYSG